MNFVFIANKSGFYELVGNSFEEFDPSTYTPSTANWVSISNPAILHVIDGKIDSVEPILALQPDWCESYNNWVMSREKTQEIELDKIQCKHEWQNYHGLNETYEYCINCNSIRR